MTPTGIRPMRLGFIGGATNSAVGYTHFTSSHLDGLFRLEAGVFSRHDDVNKASAATYEIDGDRLYSDWRSLLAGERGRLDAIAVLTPTPSHAEIVLAALDAGYPVICEKALATSSAECRAIRQAVAKNNNFLAVTFNYSGYPMVRELRELIEHGALGDIQQIQVEMPQEGFARRTAAGERCTPQPWRLNDYGVPTVSLDLGVHIHHLVAFLTGGAKPLEVIADQTSYGNFATVIDTIDCLARYERNIRVNIWFTKAALGYRNGLRIRVFGSEGAAEWLQTAPEQLSLSHADGRRTVLDLGSGTLEVAGQPRYNRFKPGHPSGFIEAFANLYADISASLKAHLSASGSASPYVFGADHAEAGLAFLESIDASAKTRAWKSVPMPTSPQ